ncbi:MAG TPA: hypothetical protein VMX96_07775 [Dehalococcoidia bacterium]|nr:hypothetical protein [Dehalococcoidia bacterium]
MALSADYHVVQHNHHGCDLPGHGDVLRFGLGEAQPPCKLKLRPELSFPGLIHAPLTA